ncbi:hypothetical protein EDB89DRAFT_1273365 [Lactarius sanguifluus]|nr:hypothetical protein EDB89DRAFT_1273365 [Lactarius sanguifluus]
MGLTLMDWGQSHVCNPMSWTAGGTKDMTSMTVSAYDRKWRLCQVTFRKGEGYRRCSAKGEVGVQAHEGEGHRLDHRAGVLQRLPEHSRVSIREYWKVQGDGNRRLRCKGRISLNTNRSRFPSASHLILDQLSAVPSAASDVIITSSCGGSRGEDWAEQIGGQIRE